MPSRRGASDALRSSTRRSGRCRGTSPTPCHPANRPVGAGAARTGRDSAPRHPAQVRDRPWASLVPCAFSAAVHQCAANNQISCGEKPPPRSQGFDPSMPLKCTAASLDSIAGDEIAKLRDFADDDVGRTNVDADQAEFREHPGQRFRLEPESPGNQRLVIR